MNIYQQVESASVRAVRKRYKNSLHSKAKEIKEFSKRIKELNSLDENQLDPDARDGLYSELYEYMHKLAGSTGMYGYSDISKKCRKAMFSIEVRDYDAIDKRLSQARKLLKFYSKKK